MWYYERILALIHALSHTEGERERDMVYIYGIRKGYAKNGNAAKNPYKQRNDSNLVEKIYGKVRKWIERGRKRVR